MNKTLLVLSACFAMAACSGNSSTENTQDTAAAADQSAVSVQSEVDTSANNIGTNRTADAPVSGSHQKGAELLSKSDCLGCHKEQDKLVGPSYKEVASKYEATEANINLLADKIVKGGSGVWGQVPMTPHPALSQEDAKEMVNYILSLK